MTWQQIVFGVFQTVILGMAVFYLKRSQEKRDKHATARVDAQKQAELLQLEMIWANNKLSYACAMALKRGQEKRQRRWRRCQIEQLAHSESLYRIITTTAKRGTRRSDVINNSL